MPGHPRRPPTLSRVTSFPSLPSSATPARPASISNILCSLGSTFPFSTVTLDAPLALPRRFRRLPPAADSGISAILSSVSLVIEVQAPTPAPCSGLRPRRAGLLCPLLTLTARPHLPMLRVASSATRRQTSPGKNSHLPAYARRIYFRAFRAGTGLRVLWPPHPARLPPMRFLFVGPAVCLRLPSDPALRRTPLPSTHRSPCRVGRGPGMLRARLTSWREPMPGAAKKGAAEGNPRRLWNPW